MLQTIRMYADAALALVGMQQLFFAVLFAVLIYENFRFTEIIYTFMVEEGFNRSSVYIEQAQSKVQEYMNSH